MRFSFPGRTSAFPFVFLVALFSLLLVFAGSCSRPPQADPAASRAAIDAVDRDFMAAFQARDGKAIGLLYTEDAKLLPPNEEPAIGRDAIVKVWEGLLGLPLSGLRLETDEIHGTGEVVTVEGRYALIGGDSQTVEAGKYLVVYKKTEAGWRLHREIWSSNAPAMAPAPADTTIASPKE
ncbi:MAG: SgcJ/EcaC family oxidoreductase [Candidatus Eisenbacteria bacterium]